MTNKRLEELDDVQLIRLRELIRKERKSSVFTHIPEELWHYCDNAIERQRADDSLLLALHNVCIDNVGVDVIFSVLNRLFQKACEVTDSNLNQLTKALDFDPKDIEKGHIDSFLAEVRALFFLSNQKFSDIRPLSRKKTRKQCDIFAWRDSQKYAVEVFHTAERPVPDLYDNDIFVHDLCNRLRDKKCQVDASLNKDDCQYGLLIYVMDRFASNIKTSKRSFKKNLCCVSDKLNWGEKYYFAIVTGWETNGILEDTIDPE